MENAIRGARILEITTSSSGQRIDNFLSRELKGVPRSYVYRILRRGEVRLNGGRVRPDRRLETGDRVRIPPVRLGPMNAPVAIPTEVMQLLMDRVLLETPDFIVINKPAGIAVHGGSGLRWGVIEAIRAARPDVPRLDLAHRLDRQTSGCLVLAKRAEALRVLNAALRAGDAEKRYLTLLRGSVGSIPGTVRAPLRRYTLSGGERKVEVSADGRAATTHFRTVTEYAFASLVEAQIETGRTHQIRVHAAHAGTPVGGDDKYGDRGFNRCLAAVGLRRLFLHAHSISIRTGRRELDATAPLDPELGALLDRLSVRADRDGSHHSERPGG